MDTDTVDTEDDATHSIPRDRIDWLRQRLEFLTEPEFAAALGLERRTPQDWRLTGKDYPPHVRKGRTIILPIPTTKQWLHDQALSGSVLSSVVHRASPRRRRAR